MRTLESASLKLRPVRMTDLPVLSEILSNAKIMKYLFGGKPLLKAEAEEFIRVNFSFQEDDSVGIGTLVENISSRIVGFAGLIKCQYKDYKQDFELGFVIAEWAQGNGYATEIGRRQIEFGFAELNLSRLLGLVHPNNTISLHILEKTLGMKMIDEIETKDRGSRQVFCLERSNYYSNIL